MGNGNILTKGIGIGIAVSIGGWALFSFFNEAINRFLEFLGNRFNMPILLDTLMQNFIVIVFIIIILVLVGFGFRKSILKVISG